MKAFIRKHPKKLIGLGIFLLVAGYGDGALLLIGLVLLITVLWVKFISTDKKSPNGLQVANSEASKIINMYLHENVVDSYTRDEFVFIARKFDELCSLCVGTDGNVLSYVEDDLVDVAKYLVNKAYNYKKLDCERNEHELVIRNPTLAARYKNIRMIYMNDIGEARDSVASSILDIREINFKKDGSVRGFKNNERIKEIVNNMVKLAKETDKFYDELSMSFLDSEVIRRAEKYEQNEMEHEITVRKSPYIENPNLDALHGKGKKEMDLLRRARKGDISSQWELLLWYLLGWKSDADELEYESIAPDERAAKYLMDRIKKSAAQGNMEAKAAIAQTWVIKGSPYGNNHPEAGAYHTQILEEADLGGNAQAMYLVYKYALVNPTTERFKYLLSAGHAKYPEAYPELMQVYWWASNAHNWTKSRGEPYIFSVTERYGIIMDDYTDYDAEHISWAKEGANSSATNADKCQLTMAEYHRKLGDRDKYFYYLRAAANNGNNEAIELLKQGSH